MGLDVSLSSTRWTRLKEISPAPATTRLACLANAEISFSAVKNAVTIRQIHFRRRADGAWGQPSTESKGNSIIQDAAGVVVHLGPSDRG